MAVMTDPVGEETTRFDLACAHGCNHTVMVRDGEHYSYGPGWHVSLQARKPNLHPVFFKGGDSKDEAIAAARERLRIGDCACPEGPQAKRHAEGRAYINEWLDSWGFDAGSDTGLTAPEDNQ